MANPNIVNVATITAQTALASLSNVTSNIITNATSSSTVIKLNTVILSNYNTATMAANVSINRNGSGTYYLGGNLSVPPSSTLVLIAKDSSIYLLEGDTLQANCGVNSSISLVSSYEIIS